MIARTLAAVALAALPMLSNAQVQQPRGPRYDGREAGLSAGRLAGREDGSDLGRTQVLLEAYIDGFRRQIASTRRSPDEIDRENDAERDGHAEGHRSGLGAGLAAGQAGGAAAATTAYARLAGRPPFLSQPPGSRPVATPPPPFPACEAPGPSRIFLPRGRTVDVDPRDIEEGRSPIPLGMPSIPFPSRSLLRDKAREAGWMAGEDVDAWVEGHRDGFEESFRGVFEEERRNVAWGTKRRYEDDGAAAGAAEAARRSACAAYARGSQRGFDDGFDEGFQRGFGEGWEAAAHEHESGPVIVVERARLADGNDDGVFEPGEPVFLDLSVANAGMVDATSGVLAWAGVQSLAGSGSIEAPLASQQRRAERLDLGSLDAGAPLGATAIVDVAPLRGARQSLSAPVGRPATIESVTAFLDMKDQSLVLVARAVIRSVATRPVDRALRVSSGGISADVGPLDPGAARDIAVILPASGSDLATPIPGELSLDGADGRWMLRRFEATTGMERAVQLCASLPAGASRSAALLSLSKRLDAEFERALREPKLYKQLDEASELARFGSALRALDAADGAPIATAVGRPLLARAEARAVPRRVRNAVRAALSVRN